MHRGSFNREYGRYIVCSNFVQTTHPPFVKCGRIYLTESMGGVLGANLLRDHNVVFDYDNHVVGFADGACDYHADSRGSDGGSAGAEVCKSIGCASCVFSCCFVWYRLSSFRCDGSKQGAIYFHHGVVCATHNYLIISNIALRHR